MAAAAALATEGGQGVLYQEEQSMLRDLVDIYSSVEVGSGLHLHELLDIIHVRPFFLGPEITPVPPPSVPVHRSFD